MQIQQHLQLQKAAVPTGILNKCSISSSSSSKRISYYSRTTLVNANIALSTLVAAAAAANALFTTAALVNANENR